MTDVSGDTRFGGSIPEIYERYLVPLIFEPYAVDLAKRVAAHRPASLLETAAGTGVATRAITLAATPAEVVATDLNQPMLDRAMAIGTARPVTWRQADASRLPFDDARFDMVVCQFGVMFFPDKVRAFSEARRVLRPGGALLFSVWDRIEENTFADCVTAALATLYRSDPPRFLARIPHGYFDRQAIARDLADAGFESAPHFETLTAESRAASARAAAVAYCQGTPLRTEIESRAQASLDDATSAAERALAKRFGAGAVDGKIQALVVTVRR